MIYPTSPDGTDWGIYGDTPCEQWAGVWLEAQCENKVRELVRKGKSIMYHLNLIPEHGSDDEVIASFTVTLDGSVSGLAGNILTGRLEHIDASPDGAIHIAGDAYGSEIETRIHDAIKADQEVPPLMPPNPHMLGH